MTRYCEECGCDVQEVVQVSPGHLRKECAECGSTGPFMVENPHYGLAILTSSVTASAKGSCCRERRTSCRFAL